MKRLSDCQIQRAEVSFLPVQTRVPLKFGGETLTEVTCCRVRMEVELGNGQCGVGWGETPLSVQWVWPSEISYGERFEALKGLCLSLARDLPQSGLSGHPMEITSDFQGQWMASVASGQAGDSKLKVPHLAALLCLSAFDIALHDAYAVAHKRPVYSCYDSDLMARDLAAYLQPAADRSDLSFAGLRPQDFLSKSPAQKLPVWHLVGGLDPISAEDLDGPELDDGHPVLLEDWLRQDGLNCLKIKLRGNDSAWDFQRIVRVGELLLKNGGGWLSTDFNCMVTDPEYVNQILDQLRDDYPSIYGALLYVEQPFPYDLEKFSVDIRSVSARKPVFLDESAHDWSFVKLGRELGWSGVALKTCKTQTGALLSLCWAKAHGLPLMVQDLTNPMLAIVPHVQLAAYAGTIMGVECNAAQFYPDASLPEAKIHRGIYERREGMVDLSTLGEIGMGYAGAEAVREFSGEIA